MGRTAAAKRQEVISPDNEAAEIGRLYELARTSLFGSVSYAIECGHKLIAKKAALKKELGHGSWSPWLAANEDVLGFQERHARKLMVAAKRPSTAVLTEITALKISRQIHGNSVKHFREDDEWYTPQRYITAARKVLGIIDLDPASSVQAQATVQALQFFTQHEDSLTHAWHGNVWLNPPYSKELLAQFVTKLIDEYQARRVTSAILLVNNFTDSDWFQMACGACAAICFPRDRIYFENANGKKDRPLNGQVFFYFGTELEAFRSVFSPIGAGFVGVGAWSWDDTRCP